MTDRDRWLAWYGPEVEGRLAGIETGFIGECADELAVKEAMNAVSHFGHVLFGTAFLQQWGYNAALESLRDGTYITLEVTPEMVRDIPRPLRHQAHLLVRIPVPVADGWQGHLKLTDTVRLDFGPLDVACATWLHFTRHHPDDYLVDKPAAWKEP